MTSKISISYNLSPFGGGVVSCSNIALSMPNATVQDAMNLASIYLQADCTNNLPVFYTAKYEPSYGNFLTHVITRESAYFPPKPDYNTTEQHWQLSINAKLSNLSMSSQEVKSNDQISWDFISRKTHSLS